MEGQEKRGGRVQLAIVGVALVAVGWFGREAVGWRPETKAETAADVQTVTAGEATRQAFNPVTEYVGHVEPAEVTDILPQIDGYVRQVFFTEGAHVAVGDLLFEIDPEQYEAARNLRYSEVRSAEAKVLVAQSEVERAERYFRRLTAADDRGITATERDTAETTLASAKAAPNSANAAVEQAKASAAIADFNLRHTKVYSPIAGRIGKALHHVGDYVSPSKSPMARVVKIDPIRVVFPITDRDYGAWQAAAERGGRAVKDSRRLRVVLPDGSTYKEEGELEFGDNEMNRKTGTVVMFVKFANATGRLLPNAYVRVLTDDRNPPEPVTVPTTAVEVTETGRRIWTLDANDRAHPVEVELGDNWNGLTEVRRGLAAGTRVVTLGWFKLKDGDQVKVVAE